MMTVTEQAGDTLQRFLTFQEAGIDQAARLVRITSRQYRIELDKEHDGDDVIEHAGRTVLLVGPEVAQDLIGATLDVVPTDAGPQLVLRIGENP